MSRDPLLYKYYTKYCNRLHAIVCGYSTDVKLQVCPALGRTSHESSMSPFYRVMVAVETKVISVFHGLGYTLCYTVPEVYQILLPSSQFPFGLLVCSTLSCVCIPGCLVTDIGEFPGCLLTTSEPVL